MRQVALEVFGVALAVLRVVQQGIDVVEDVPLRDFGAVLRLELCQRPIGDVLSPIAAIFGVGVVGEALCLDRLIPNLDME